MKSKLLKGTLILTAAGIITRLLGFFYRIYLSKTIGAEGLGLYQLVFPIYAIAFTLYASGLQTAISQIISSEKSSKKCIASAMGLSVITASVLSVLLYIYSEPIAVSYLKAEDAAPLLRILSYIFPFCGVTSIINGIFYGLNKASVPAITQLIEQVVRIAFVIVMTLPSLGMSAALSCELAVWGLIVGELASNLFNVISLIRSRKKLVSSSRKYVLKLLKLAVPLSGTRLIISMLNSLEAVLIPVMLFRFGMDNSGALSIYGILSGMVLPFILFPGAITNSLSVLMIPTISSAYGRDDLRKIKITSQIAVKYTLLLGLLSTFIFSMFGRTLGTVVYGNTQAGNYLVVMSVLCPFIYCSTTLSSIINGLGKTHITFRNTVIGLAVRILFLIVFVPNIGIMGYLIGMFISQFLITVLDAEYLYRVSRFQLKIIRWFVIPGIFLWCVGFLLKNGTLRLLVHYHGNKNFFILCLIPVICVIFVIFSIKTKIIEKDEI